MGNTRSMFYLAFMLLGTARMSVECQTKLDLLLGGVVAGEQLQRE